MWTGPARPTVHVLIGWTSYFLAHKKNESTQSDLSNFKICKS